MRLVNLYKKLKLNSTKWWIKVYQTFWQIKEIRIMLSGYKSYIVAVLAAIVTFLHAMGYIDDVTFQTFMGLLGAGAVATIRAGINNSNKK